MDGSLIGGLFKHMFCSQFFFHSPIVWPPFFFLNGKKKKRAFYIDTRPMHTYTLRYTHAI